MATNFPTSVDNFTNPTANDSLNLPSHSTQHANANDAIEAVESYLLTEPMGLRLVKKQTIGTAVSSVEVTNAFSANYQNYIIKVSGGTNSASQASLSFKLGSLATGYYGAFTYSTYAGTLALTQTNNGSSFPYFGVATTAGMTLHVDVLNPFLAMRTMVSADFFDNSGAGRTVGYISSEVSQTNFTLTTSSGNMTGGTIYVYGYTI